MGPRSCRSDEAAREITWALRLASKEHHAAVMCRQFSKNDEAVFPLIRRSIQALSKGHRRGGGSAGGRGPRARGAALTCRRPTKKRGWTQAGKRPRPQAMKKGPTPSDWALAGFLRLEKMIGQRRTGEARSAGRKPLGRREHQLPGPSSGIHPELRPHHWGPAPARSDAGRHLGDTRGSTLAEIVSPRGLVSMIPRQFSVNSAKIGKRSIQ